MPTTALTPFDERAIVIPQKTIAAASIGATYSIVGSIFSSAPVMLIIVSSLDATVQISLDGVTDFIPVLANASIILDLKSDGMALSGASGVYVKEIGNPTTGTLYVGGFTV